MQPVKNASQENIVPADTTITCNLGNGLIVTLLDYIVGRASHQYLPSDHRTNKNYNSLIHDYTPGWPSKLFSQGIASNNRPYPANNNNNNNNNMYENSDPFHYYPTPNAITNADDKPWIRFKTGNGNTTRLEH